MLETFVEVVHILVAVFMILVVLIQGGNQGGVGAAFGGGGNSGGVFGATGATTFLGKLTYFAAGIFMVTSITLTVMQGGAGDVGLKERLKQQGGAVPTENVPGAETGVEAPAEKDAPVEGLTPEVNENADDAAVPSSDEEQPAN